MIKIVISLCIVFFSLTVFSQPGKIQAHTKDYYLKKSAEQKKTGWVILGTGLSIAAIGGVVQLSHANDFDFTGAWMAIGGGAISLFSIPFFISSSKNKQKATSIAINVQDVLLPRQGVSSHKTQPVIKLSVRL